jgi:hypothetical protein
MSEIIDQRRSERHGCQYPLFCSNLNGRKVYADRVVNYCDQGFSFVSDTPFKRGMTLFFRSDRVARARGEGERCAGMRESGVVLVRWWQTLSAKSAAAYRMGAEYVQPYP